MLVKTDEQNRYAIAEFQNGGWKRLMGKGDPYYGVTTGFPDGRRKAKKGNTTLQDALNKSGTLLMGKE